MKKLYISIASIATVAVAVAITNTYRNSVPATEATAENHISAETTVDVNAAPADKATAAIDNLAPQLDAGEEIDTSRIISSEIETALSGGYGDGTSSPLNQVKDFFPELRTTIEAYQASVNAQKQRLQDYHKKLADYNEQVKLAGYASTELDANIAEEQAQLLAAARELGQQGIALNEAIREQAARRL